jgi:hypothetical protein
MMSKLFQSIKSVLTGKIQSSVPVPEVKAPKIMPMADDDAAMAARRRQIAEMQARSGRASTILSQDDKLGG